MDNIDRLQQPQLAALVAAGSIRSVTVEPAPDQGWAVRVRYGMREAVMASQHRPVRVWRSLDTLAQWLAARGIGHWEVRTG